MNYVDPDDLTLIRALSPSVGVNYRRQKSADDASPSLRLKIYGDSARAADIAGSGDRQLDSITVRRAGHFGNNTIQLVNAIMIAEQSGIPLVRHIFPAFGRAPKSLPVRLKFGNPRSWRREVGLRGRFFVRYHNAILREKTTPEFLETFDRYLLPALRWKATTSKGQLVLNLRGGSDIFADVPPAEHYGQPPLSYYILAAKTVIEHHDVQSIVIVHQDNLNPVLPALSDWAKTTGLPLSMVSAGPEGDAAALLEAEHIVMGCTTFTEALALFSPGLNSISTFGREHLVEALDLAVPIRRRFGDDGSYLPTKSWTGTAEQRSQMLNFPADQLTMTETTSPHAAERRARILERRKARRLAWF